MVLIGVGRTADVYVLDERWVLRRYRDGVVGDAETERTLMTYLRGHGYPVPLVRPAQDGSSRTDLVLERLDGPTMAGALAAGLVTPRQAGAMLARLLTGLHAVPARRADGPGRSILHLDLHPENIILTSGGPRVIDWANASEGCPGLDWAMSAVILAEVAIGTTRTARPARELLSALLTDPAAVHLTPEALAEALRRRAADPMTTECETAALGRAGDAVRELVEPRPA
jgi:aminoglycoside phosphotransferase (APT) family kinase protein